MSYGIYVGKNHSRTGHAWLGGYGDEPSSHWLEIVPEAEHKEDAVITVGVGPDAQMSGVRREIPQVPRTLRHIRVSYSYYLGVPAPITNGGLNAAGVAVRDIWSTSRAELIAMTPKDQQGLNYSDLARCVMERATTAREAVAIAAALIATYGEASYGGNSHIFADAHESWVMIQFAGGQGLWVAERLGADSIRASRPGYVLEVPVDTPDHPDFLFSENFVSFAQEQGWYSDGPFDANAVYGDAKGRWAGVDWIEREMAARAARDEKIGLEDMMWAVRCPRLTGDTAGYGQVVPLIEPLDAGLRMLWHTPVGAVAAPFAPVYLGQATVPPEFGAHRYLRAGESHRFMDMRKAVAGGADVVSEVPQAQEAVASAVYEAKRLMYLMQLGDGLAQVSKAFETREAQLEERALRMMRVAEVLALAGRIEEATDLLGYFSETELRAGLDLVRALGSGLEAQMRAGGQLPNTPTPRAFDQIW